MIKSSEDKSREVITAILLITFCVISMIVGLFLVNQKSSKQVDADGAKLVSSLVNDKVAVIALDGPIYESFETKTPFSSGLSIAETKRELKKAIEDKKTKAVLIRANSPGGTVGASQELYSIVKNIKNAKKPVVVSMGDVCASGCYYIASAANKIMANSGTLTGSIGVISHGFNFTGLMEKLGIENQTFKAGKYKDLASGQRPITEEEQKIMDDLLADSYDQFLTDIVSGRGLDRAQLEQNAQGLIYTGRQALKVNLVDELGTYEDSKKLVRKILKEEYSYAKADSISFEETWNSGKLSAFEEFIGFGMSSKSIADNFYSAISNAFGVKKEKVNPNSLSWSKFQPLWMMP